MKAMDLTKGSVFKTLAIYSLPLIATNVAQLLFHATDVWVLGMMADDGAVASVGACGALISLFVSVFAGLATGTNILIARRVGAKDIDGARRATGTGLVIGLLSGIILMIVALIGAKEFLIMMNCQPEVLEEATLYMRIYFMGMPVIMLYNFVSAILRSVGDSMRPMIYMFVAGGLNVGLNVLFIGAFKMTVDGVALATVLSNLVSLILAMIALFKNGDYCKVEMKNLRVRRTELWETVRVGVPASLGGLCFYAANTVVGSAVNALSTDAMTANAISGQFDGIIYSVGMSVATACMAMVGQSLGARDIPRIKKTVLITLCYSTAVSLALGAIFVLLSEPMLGIMTDSESVIALAKSKMTLLCLTYFITTIMEVFSFSLRALHKAGITTVVCFICGFGVRAGWIWLMVPVSPTLPMIFASYPVSAFAAILFYIGIFIYTVKGLSKRVSVPEGEKIL